MSITLQNTSDDLSLRADGGNRTTEFVGDIPRYVEGAAEAICTALHTFLRYDHIPNPAGGPDVPWVAEIRIPVAREINPKTGVTYTSVEAAWFDKDHIEDLAAVLASHWCQPPEILVSPLTTLAMNSPYNRLRSSRLLNALGVRIAYFLTADEAKPTEVAPM